MNRPLPGSPEYVFYVHTANTDRTRREPRYVHFSASMEATMAEQRGGSRNYSNTTTVASLGAAGHRRAVR